MAAVSDLRRAPAPGSGALDRLASLSGVGRVVVLVGVALAVRLMLLAVVRGDPLAGDAATQVDLAARLAGGLGLSGFAPQVELHPTASVAPAYPFVLGAVFEVLGVSVTAARLVGLGLGIGVVLLVDRLGVRVGAYAFGRSDADVDADAEADGPAGVPARSGTTAATPAASLTGLVAALLVAVAPAIAVRDVLPLASTLVVVLLVAALVFLLDGRAVAAAIAVGALVLARPEYLVVALVLAAWTGWRLDWRRAGWFALVVGLVLFPWLLRNSMLLGVPVVSTDLGRQLAALYSDEASASGVGVDALVDPRFDDLALTRFDEAAWDRALRERAVDDVRAHPRQVVAAAGRNALAVLELQLEPNRLADERDGVPARLRPLAVGVGLVVGGAGVVGLARARRSRGAELVGVAAVTIVGTQLLLVVATPTGRVPVDVLLCVGAALTGVGAVRRSERLGPST